MQTEIAQARDKLEVALNGAKIEKQTNSQYNENEYLEEYILKQIKDAEIVEDIAIVDNYGFRLDRSVPKIEEEIGKKDDLVFPEVTVSNPILAEDLKTPTFTITAKEEKNGIHKVEIIQNGKVVQKSEYENTKDEIVQNFTVKQNGNYLVKVYANLATSKLVMVNGIVIAIEYKPNGNEKYQKEHLVTINVKESADKVKSIKYQWLNTIEEPTEDTFVESCSIQETITGNGFTGTYYLWTLLETQSGRKEITRSEAFHFDNQGPTVTLNVIPVTETSFTITAEANDNYSKLAECKFYLDDEWKITKDITEGTAEHTVTVSEMGDDYSCYVIVTDLLGNTTKQTITARTKMYTWECWDVVEKVTYTTVEDGSFTIYPSRTDRIECYNSCSLDSNTGEYTFAPSEPMRIVSAAVSGKCSPNGSNGFKVYHVESVTSFDATVRVDYYKSNKKSTFSKGTTKKPQVYHKNRSEYPDQGHQSKIWYIYKGIK